MRRIVTFCFLAAATLVALFTSVHVQAAKPGNNDFASATAVLSLPYNPTGQSNVDATTETNEPLPCASIGRTVWYKYTPTRDESLTIDTNGSTYDTVLAAYYGTSFAGLTLVGCDDNSGEGSNSLLTLLARAGQTYYFQVGGASGDSGTIDFNIATEGSSHAFPSLYYYGGRLTSSGSPVNGTRQVKFSVYDAATGGTELWTETQAVTATNGYFRAYLGSVTGVDPAIFADSLTGTTRFLEIHVLPDASPMMPRQRLASVPNAALAQAAELAGIALLSQDVATDYLRGDVSDVFTGDNLTIESGSVLSYKYANWGLNLSADGTDGDQLIHFYEDGNPHGEALKWDDSEDEFQLTDRLNVWDDLNVGSSGYGRVRFGSQGFLSYCGTGVPIGSCVYFVPPGGSQFYLSDSLVVDGDIVTTTGSFIDDGTTLNAPDYVFEKDYPLMPLTQLRDFVMAERHLPNVPSADDIRRNGLNMSAFQMQLLEKTEELTLYTLAQEDRIAQLESENAAQDLRLAEFSGDTAAQPAPLQASSSSVPVTWLIVGGVLAVGMLIGNGLMWRVVLRKRESDA